MLERKKLLCFLRCHPTCLLWICFSALTSFLYPNLPFSFSLSCHSSSSQPCPTFYSCIICSSENMKIWNGKGNIIAKLLPLPQVIESSFKKGVKNVTFPHSRFITFVILCPTQGTVWWERGCSQAKKEWETKVKMDHLSLTIICSINSVFSESHTYSCQSALGSCMKI